VALPVTANFIDPPRLGLVEAARLPGEGCGTVQNLRLRKGHSVAELTLPAESPGGQLRPVPLPRRDGGFNGTGGNDQPLGGCRFSQEAAPLRYGKGKVLHLLVFIPRTGRARFLIGPCSTRPFPRHTFARQFFRTFSVLLQTYPY
jgi:hypothetical protein